MTKQDGHVVGMSTIVDHGPADLLLNIVIVSEGFREEELPEFSQYVRRFADYLFTFPLSMIFVAASIYTASMLHRMRVERTIRHSAVAPAH
jgi:hypothetical protein